RSGESVCGLLEIFSSRPAAFTAGDDAIMKRLAQISLTAVHRAAKASATKREQPVPLKSVPEMPARLPQLILVPPREPRGWGWQLPRPLYISVGLTLLLVAGWLYAPNIRNGLRSVNATSPAAAAVPKAVSAQPKSAREVTDINGLRHQAELGDAAAQFALGIHYSTGDEVPHDDADAARWIAMAAEQNHPVAQAFLGEFYREGRGVPKNYSKAYMWFALAPATGAQASRFTINALASRMTPTDRLAAEQQANEWLKTYQLKAKTSSSH